jgi:hypothetical protein
MNLIKILQEGAGNMMGEGSSVLDR